MKKLLLLLIPSLCFGQVRLTPVTTNNTPGPIVSWLGVSTNAVSAWETNSENVLTNLGSRGPSIEAGQSLWFGGTNGAAIYSGANGATVNGNFTALGHIIAGAYGSPWRFIGDGSGITNIGTSSSSQYATNAGVASYVSGTLSNNITGSSSSSQYATNTPYGGVIAGLSGTNVFTGNMTLTNSSLLVTGANYIALSNGTARVLLTNGTITASGVITTVGVTLGGGAGTTRIQSDASMILGNYLRSTYAGDAGSGGSGASYTCDGGIDVVKSIRVLSNIYVARDITVTNSLVCSNLTLSTVRWTDSPMQFFWGATGPTLPDTTAVTNNSAINGMGFTLAGEGTQKVYGSAQIPHSIAASNSTLYTEWHLHLSPATAVGTTSNAAFTIIYDFANIGDARYGPITNVAQVGMVGGKFNYLLEFGHLPFTNFCPSISAVSRCTIFRSAATSNDFSGAVILDGADIHYPVDKLGSAADSAP